MAEDNGPAPREDNGPAPRDEGRVTQARGLAEAALAAERAGDQATADRLFNEAERADPGAAADVLAEYGATGDRRRPRAEAAPQPGGGGFVATSAPPAAELRAWRAEGTAGAPRVAPGRPTTVEITLRVNEQTHRLTVDTRATLLDALRDQLHLTGTKKGCALGQCGACTVLLDGRRINSCLLLAAMADQKPIVTIEGLARGGQLHPMQAAFVEHDGFQCGYCTPGQIMSAIGLLGERKAESEDEIRGRMSGNICRCGAYVNIIAAIEDVAAQRAAQEE